MNLKYHISEDPNEIQKTVENLFRTKTMNRWKKMLILNLQNGFDIVETYTDKRGQLKIMLEKLL